MNKPNHGHLFYVLDFILTAAFFISPILSTAAMQFINQTAQAYINKDRSGFVVLLAVFWLMVCASVSSFLLVQLKKLYIKIINKILKYFI